MRVENYLTRILSPFFETLLLFPWYYSDKTREERNRVDVEMLEILLDTSKTKEVSFFFLFLEQSLKVACNSDLILTASNILILFAFPLPNEACKLD